MEIADKHTLYIKCNYGSEKQIYDVLNAGLTKYQHDNKITNLNCRFRVNYITNKEGEPLGLAFAFFTDEPIYHMILGRNPDGTERFVEYDDPSWQVPAKDESVNENGWGTTGKLSKIVSWADETEAAEEEERKYTCPKIRTALPPLIVIPPVMLNESQMDEKRQEIIEDNEGKLDFDPKMVRVAREEYLIIDGAMVKPLETKYIPNILKASNVPRWMTVRHLKGIFSPYARDSTTKQKRIVHGSTITEPYPFINFSEKDGKRSVFAIFDPETTNARFALHMQMKTVIRDTIDNLTCSSVLIFYHAFKTDRDIMTDINKRSNTSDRGGRGGDRGGSRGRGDSRGGRGGRGGGGQRSDGHSSARFSALTEDDE